MPQSCIVQLCHVSAQHFLCLCKGVTTTAGPLSLLQDCHSKPKTTAAGAPCVLQPVHACIHPAKPQGLLRQSPFPDFVVVLCRSWWPLQRSIVGLPFQQSVTCLEGPFQGCPPTWSSCRPAGKASLSSAQTLSLVSSPSEACLSKRWLQSEL